MNTLEAALKMAFEYKGGHWMSWRMLFGCTNALATFARNMNSTITETKEALTLRAPNQDMDNYYNDCILSGPSDNWLSHLHATVIFLSIAVSHRWKFKIQISYPEIKILGVIVSTHGKLADPAKFDALLAMKTPQNVSEVKSFVGLIH
jgi:hypothetical protein